MDLFEERQHLPLRKDAIESARGRYAAFICTMNPIDFIRLTTKTEAGVENIIQRTYDTTLADYASNTNQHMQMSNYNIPFLDIQYTTGQVLGHEGRHRAALVHKAGGKSFPCYLVCKTAYRIILSYSDIDDNEFTETFDNADVAVARREELEAAKDDEGYRKYWSIKWTHEGSNILRGAPDRSDPSTWTFAKWIPEDAPKVLIGQFNPSVRVTDFKIGLVKGYGHFKR